MIEGKSLFIGYIVGICVTTAFGLIWAGGVLPFSITAVLASVYFIRKHAGK